MTVHSIAGAERCAALRIPSWPGSARVIVPDVRLIMSRSAATAASRRFSRMTILRSIATFSGEACREANVGVWAWCLMPNHVHLILTPSDEDGLRRALARVHRRYAGDRQRQAASHRAFLAGPVRRGGDGRRSPCRSVPLCELESRSRAAGGAGAGLAMVERAGAFGPRRGRLDRRRSRRALASPISPICWMAPPTTRQPLGCGTAESVGRPVGSAAFIARLEEPDQPPLATAEARAENANWARNQRRRRVECTVTVIPVIPVTVIP